MSTFVVRVFEERPGGCRGRIRHVASGEEAAFADERGLLAFIDRMKFLGTLVRDGVEAPECTPEPSPSADRQRNRPTRGGLS